MGLVVFTSFNVAGFLAELLARRYAWLGLAVVAAFAAMIGSGLFFGGLLGKQDRIAWGVAFFVLTFVAIGGGALLS